MLGTIVVAPTAQGSLPPPQAGQEAPGILPALLQGQLLGLGELPLCGHRRGCCPSIPICPAPHLPQLPGRGPTQVVEVIFNATPCVLLNEGLYQAPGLLPVADLRGHAGARQGWAEASAIPGCPVNPTHPTYCWISSTPHLSCSSTRVPHPTYYAAPPKFPIEGGPVQGEQTHLQPSSTSPSGCS